MRKRFPLKELIDFPNTGKIYFYEYLKKNNEQVEINEPICVIRIGSYNSVFRFQLITINSPLSGFLEHIKSIDQEIEIEDEILSILEKPNYVSEFENIPKFEHFFKGESYRYSFINWNKKNQSYINYNEPIFSYSSINFPFRIHYAEKSGLLNISNIKIPFLKNGQFMYSIESCEPFENEEINIADNIQSSDCYVYLMKDTVNNYYKIGISNNPTYREKTLQSEKPTIELIIAKKFTLRLIAESFEKALHNSFAHKRIRGEWFALEQNEIEHLKKSLE